MGNDMFFMRQGENQRIASETRTLFAALKRRRDQHKAAGEKAEAQALALVIDELATVLRSPMDGTPADTER